MKKGIQTEIFNYIINKYSNSVIYSVVDYTNTASMVLHKKMNFTPLKDFTHNNNNYVILKLNKQQ